MSNEDALKKAIESGISAEDIAADLADDGVLNNSHITGILATKENTSALEKATEAAKATHKLLTALIPILLLVATSGLELGGIIDITPAGEGDDWVWEDDEYWGCVNPDAVNYDPMATHDDGSCDFPRYGCTDPEASNYEAMANENDGSCEYGEHNLEPSADIINMQTTLVNDDTEIRVSFDLITNGDFNDDIEITWRMLYNDEPAPEYEVKTWEDPYEAGYVEWVFEDLDTGEYEPIVIARFHDDILDQENFPSVTIEEPESCEPFFYDYYMGFNNESQTGFFFEADVDLNCDETQEVQLQFLAYENGSTYGDSPTDYGILYYNVTNADVGYHNITLPDLPNGSYDLYAYLINDDGEIMKELTWWDLEIQRDE